MKNVHKNCILILDFGSQYTQLLVRRIRELGVYCQLWMWNIPESQIHELNPSGIILSGGPISTIDKNSPRAPNYVFQAGVPVLGICYGMQTMAVQLGGKVQRSAQREFGYARAEIIDESLLIQNIQDDFNNLGIPMLDVWMSHGDQLTAIPKDFITVARTKTCPFTIISNEIKRFYGVQFHPEVTHTRQGRCILKRFALSICHSKQSWTPPKIIKDIITNIRNQVGKDQVILGLSGGVDSSVTAILLNQAIGDKLICVFIDNGLLRYDEANYVINMFKKYYDLNVIYVNEEDRFFSALSGIKDPEVKRKTVGRIFIEVFNEQAMNFNKVKWLAQGTICSDVIESASLSKSNLDIIKSHHNVGGLPKIMRMGLIEPLRNLFKDEVRKIGLELGLPYDMLYRHPFPGPGLSVRIIGEVKKEYCDLLRRADAIFLEELHNANMYNKISQAFTIFLPLRTVSVMGDSRKYGWVLSVRAVETVDFMTARWSHLPYELLERISNRIINEVEGISRVVYDISGKPPATIEWE